MTAKPVPEVSDINRIYFEGCAQGELRVRHCPRCDTKFRFAHEWCPNCWSLDISWQKVSGRGRIVTYCIVHQPPSPAFADMTPYALALIDLDEGVRMMSNVIGCKPEQVKIGLPVKVTFEKRGDVHLPMFVLADG
jgi:uncharacterized OB-fold protein